MIVPAFRAERTLALVLEALRPQVERRGRELLIVESSGDGAARELERRCPWARVVALPERTLPGRARNIGASAAAGTSLAFLDADAVPEPDWLDLLESALVPGVDAVAGSVVNGTPGSAIGTAGYLLEFADWLPGRDRALGHAATCNLLVRREAFAARGGFPEDVFPGEDTIFTFPLAAAGRLAFAPAARVSHLNRTGLGEFLAHQRRLGGSFAEVCAQVEFPHRALGRPVLAPVAAPFRLAALARRLRHYPREAVAALRVLPLLVAGLLAWGVGLAGARR